MILITPYFPKMSFGYAEYHSSLKIKDCHSLQLVKVGNRVKVTMISKSLKMENIAIARANGKLHDIIYLTNIKTNKNIPTITSIAQSVSDLILVFNFL